EKIAHLQTMTPQKLVPHSRDGKLYYAYADAEFCKCLYVGDPAAYQKYQQLAVQQKLAQEQVNAAAMNENAAMNWGLWGPFWGSPCHAARPPRPGILAMTLVHRGPAFWR